MKEVNFYHIGIIYNFNIGCIGMRPDDRIESVIAYQNIEIKKNMIILKVNVEIKTM